jgi:hypothetical protein
MTVIRELIKPLNMRAGLLAYLDHTASKLTQMRETDDQKAKQDSLETEKYLLNKLKQLGTPKKLQDIYYTREGMVIRAFEELYAIHGTSLTKKLSKISVPLDFNRILQDRNTYWRFMNFYDESVMTHIAK